MHPMTLTADVLDRSDALAEEWRELADRVGATPFAYPEWVEAWRDAFGRGRPVTLVVRRDGELAGLLPLERRGSVLRSTTNWHTPLFQPLWADAAALAELARALFDLRARSVSLAFLDPSAGDLARLVTAAEAARRTVLVRTYTRSPYLAIRGTWADYFRGVSRNLRGDVLRKWRRLEEEGRVSFEVADGTTNLEEGLEETFAVEAASWKGERGTAIASRPDTRRFYTEMARWAAGAGILRLSVLRLEGRPLAVELGLECSRVYYSLKHGYDPAYSRFSPGKLLAYRLLERAFASELSTFEFLGGDEPHKLLWTDTTRELGLLQAFSPSPAGRAELLAYRYGRPLAKQIISVRLRP